MKVTKIYSLESVQRDKMDCVSRRVKGGIGLAGLKISEIRTLLRKGGLPDTGNRMNISKRLVESEMYEFDGETIRIKRENISSIRDRIVTRYDSSSYIPEIGKRSLIECFPLHGYNYRQYFSSDNLSEQRSITLQREEELGIMEGLRHPFPSGIGLTLEGQPTSSLSDFTKSKDYPLALLRAMQVLSESSNNMEILNVLHANMEGKLICRVDFTVLSIQEAMRNPRVSKLATTLSAGIEHMNSRILMAKEDDGTILMLRDCIRQYRTVHIVVYMLPQKGRSGHVSQLQVNVRDKRVYYIDSSILGGLSHVTFAKSLEFFLEESVGFSCTVVPNFDSSLCIQELSPTCAGWTLYILLLSVLNSELTGDDLINIITRYDTYSRDLLISTFYFYLFQVTDHIRISPSEVDNFCRECQELPSFY